MTELEINPAQLDAYQALLAQEIEASVETQAGELALHADAYEAHLRCDPFLRCKALTGGRVRSLNFEETAPLALRCKSAI